MTYTSSICSKMNIFLFLFFSLSTKKCCSHKCFVQQMIPTLNTKTGKLFCKYIKMYQFNYLFFSSKSIVPGYLLMNSFLSKQMSNFCCSTWMIMPEDQYLSRYDWRLNFPHMYHFCSL